MRVWLNHWFSTAYRIIEMIKNNEDNQEFYIIGTNDKKDCVYKKVCDEFYVEPLIAEKDNYVDWCKEFCKENDVEIFMPRRGMIDIVKRIKEFEEIGVKVLAHKDYEIMSILDNKYETAELFKEYDICKVPEIEIATNLKEFDKGYGEIKKLVGKKGRVCMKYSVGEGAVSFVVIDDKVNSIEILNSGVGKKMSLSQVRGMLGSVEEFEELMIMPYLKGKEISIDSIMTNEGFIAVPRYKVGGRVTQIDIDNKLIEISRKFAENSGIRGPYNLQLRYHEGELNLLEVNTRMSGGVHISCMSGVNIPYISIKDLLGQEIDIPKKLKSIKVTQIETPIIL